MKRASTSDRKKTGRTDVLHPPGQGGIGETTARRKVFRHQDFDDSPGGGGTGEQDSIREGHW
ncbi:MAG TPA: hypothetical protein DD706_22075 [Nitrospiraceae bacterium]|nr:hypothetical protein [Nitrospiraceae bacterium]